MGNAGFVSSTVALIRTYSPYIYYGGNHPPQDPILIITGPRFRHVNPYKDPEAALYTPPAYAKTASV